MLFAMGITSPGPGLRAVGWLTYDELQSHYKASHTQYSRFIWPQTPYSLGMCATEGWIGRTLGQTERWRRSVGGPVILGLR